MNKFKVGDKVRIKVDARLKYGGNGRGVECLITSRASFHEDAWMTNTGYYNAEEDFELIEESIIKDKLKLTMKNIITFAKNLTLTSEEKLLRECGLKTECGDYTEEAKALVIDKLVKENEIYLITTATALKAEEDKK